MAFPREVDLLKGNKTRGDIILSLHSLQRTLEWNPNLLSLILENFDDLRAYFLFEWSLKINKVSLLHRRWFKVYIQQRHYIFGLWGYKVHTLLFSSLNIVIYCGCHFWSIVLMSLEFRELQHLLSTLVCSLDLLDLEYWDIFHSH